MTTRRPVPERKLKTRMNLQGLLNDFKPFDGQLLDLAVTTLTTNKTEYLNDVDGAIQGLEKQGEAAITNGLAKSGGILKMLFPVLQPELIAFVNAEVAAGEADLGTLYDKVVAAIAAEAKTLGG